MKIEDKLVNYPLFKNITGQEVRQLMACINFTEKSYKKSEYLLMEGEKVNRNRNHRQGKRDNGKRRSERKQLLLSNISGR